MSVQSGILGNLSSNKSYFCRHYAGGTIGQVGSARFAYITGGNNTADPTVEANAQTYMPNAGTFKNASVIIIANASTTQTVIVLRKNGTTPAGTLTLTIPITTTGIFIDNTDTLSVLSTDLVNWSIPECNNWCYNCRVL